LRCLNEKNINIKNAYKDQKKEDAENHENSIMKRKKSQENCEPSMSLWVDSPGCGSYTTKTGLAE
jgi:hypothetical protein